MKYLHMLECTQYNHASQSGDIVFLPRFFTKTSHCQKVHPRGSDLESMLSAVDKRDICSHMTGLRVKIIILLKF